MIYMNHLYKKVKKYMINLIKMNVIQKIKSYFYIVKNVINMKEQRKLKEDISVVVMVNGIKQNVSIIFVK